MPPATRRKKKSDTKSPEKRKNRTVKGAKIMTKRKTKKMKDTEQSKLVDICKKPALLIVPGASGKFSNQMNSFIDQYLSVHFTILKRDGRWKGWKPLGDVNVRSVLELAPTDGRWFALGNSFGNRVLCELLASDKFENPPQGLILFGYPLYGEKCTPERLTTLQSLPSSAKILAISGTNDEFLGRAPDHSTLRGEELFRSILDTIPPKDSVALHMVIGGGHGVFDVGAKQFENVASSVLDLIAEFTK